MVKLSVLCSMSKKNRVVVFSLLQHDPVPVLYKIISTMLSLIRTARKGLEAQESKALDNQVGLGWLRFTTATANLDYWRERIARYFRCNLRSRGKGWNGYLHSDESCHPIIIAHTPVMTAAQRETLGIKRSPNEGYMTVDIPQSALDSLDGKSLFLLWLDIYDCDAKLTRVDLYYDDYCKIISPEAVHYAVKRGGVGIPRFSGNVRGWDEYDLGKGSTASYTVYFGSVKSDKQVRFYDKNAESKGKQDCYRWEVQFTGKYAKEFGDSYLEVLSDATGAATMADTIITMSNGYKAHIKGAIAFHEIPPGKVPSELGANWAKRHDVVWWWSELMAGLEPAKLTLKQVKPSLTRAVEWIRSQVAPSLSVIRTAYRHWNIPFTEWLRLILDEGEDRLGDRHWQMMEDALLTSPAY